MNLTKKQKQEIRKLSLFNDFIFAKIMSNKDNCKHLLELILEKKDKLHRNGRLSKNY